MFYTATETNPAHLLFYLIIRLYNEARPVIVLRIIEITL